MTITTKFGVLCEVQIKIINGVETTVITPLPKDWKNPQKSLEGWC